MELTNARKFTDSSARKGFTLIELLVVIAIIGLLSSVILASLNSARNKGKDAAIKAGVDQLVTLMGENYDDYTSYANLQYGWITAGGYSCSTAFTGTYASQAQAICTSIFNNAAENGWGGPGAYKIYMSNAVSTVTAYSIMVQLNDGKWYCAGSSGVKKEYDSYGGAYPSGVTGCWGQP